MPTPAELATRLHALTASVDAEVVRHSQALAGLTADLDSVSDAVGAIVIPPPTPPPVPPTGTLRFPGDVVQGTIRFGAAVASPYNDGTGRIWGRDPYNKHERRIGHSLGLHRTFWGPNDRAAAVAMVKADAAAGRLSWISFKVPSVSSMAAGNATAWIDPILRDLEAIGAPVWVSFFHEPEDNIAGGEFTAAQWRQIQLQVRERMDALDTKNIALGGCLMWWTFDSRSGRNPEDYYPGPDVFDFMGSDHYIENAAATTISNAAYGRFVSWCKSKGLAPAFGELGNRGDDAAAAAELKAFYERCITDHVVGIAYFDSSYNSKFPEGWILTGAELTAFEELVRDPRSVLLS